MNNHPILTKCIFFAVAMIIVNILLTEHHKFFNIYIGLFFFIGITMIDIIDPLIMKIIYKND